MAGKIKQMINTIYDQRAGNNEAVRKALNVKFILKGIYVDTFNDDSPDDEEKIAKIMEVAQEMGVNLN